MLKTIGATVLIAGSAQAGCLEGEVTFLSCQIENSSAVLRVCHDDTTIHYRFGALGEAPELELSEDIWTVDYRPWGGVGRAIFEEVDFSTGPYIYTVYGGYERMFGDEEYEDIPHRSFGGVVVFQGDVEIANRQCQRETVDFAANPELFDAKEALGSVWDYRVREWIELPD